MASRQSKIVDQYGRPIDVAVLTEEIARPTLTGIRSVWQNLPIAANLSPASLAALLNDAVQDAPRNYLTLAEEMEERDWHYSSVLGTRKRAVSGLPVVVESASDSAADKKLADEVRELVRQPEFTDMLDDALDALGKGYSAIEILWNRGAEWSVKDYVWRDPRFFIFDRATLSELMLLDDERVMGRPLDPYKFIVHKPRLKSGIPIRGGLARLAAAAYMCKAYTLTDWMAFAEVFGMPLRIGRYGQGATGDDIDTLITAVANIGSDAAAILPDSMRIEFEQASAGRVGGDKLFLALADWLDRQVSKAVLGQTLTTDALSTGLGSNVASVHDDVRSDIQRADAHQLSATLNRDLVLPFINLNHGPQEFYPRIEIQLLEREDLAALSTALGVLVPLGLRVGASTIRDKLGLPDPVEGEELLEAPVGPVPQNPLANAEAKTALNADTTPGAIADDRDDIDDLVDEGAADWRVQMDPWVEAIERLAAEVADAGGGQAEFLARLPALFADMDENDIAERMGAATFKARALGDATDNPVA